MTRRGRKRLLVLLSSIVVVLVAVTVWLAGSGHKGTGERARQAYVRAWTEREERFYDLDMRVLLKGGDQSTQFTVTGDWALAAVQAGTRTVLRAVFSNPKLVADSTDKDVLRRYEAELTRPVFIHLGPRQEVALVSVPPGTSTFIENLIKATAAFTQFVTPAAPRRSWTMVEDDTLGRYTAKYEQVAPQRFTKAKQTYVEVLATGPTRVGALPVTRVEHYKAVFTLSDATVADLRLSERLVTEGQRGQMTLPPIAVETTLSLRRKKVGKTSVDLLAARADLARQPANKLYHLSSSGVRKSDLNHARTGGSSLTDMLAGLRSLPSDPREARIQRTRTFVAMAALLREDETAVEDASASLRTTSPTRETIVDALGSAGSVKAQAALLRLLESGDHALRRRAVQALGNASNLTPDSSEALHELFDDAQLGGDAKLALGAATNGMLAEEEKAAKENVAFLTQALEASKTVGEIVDALRAIGNAGHPAALPKVEPYLSDERAMVRSAAAQALRRIEGIKADQLLARAIRTDIDVGVRRSALDAARNRQPSAQLLQAVIESVKLDTNASARLEAARALSRWVDRASAVRQALQWVAFNDENEKIRSFASAALAAM